MEDSGLTVDNVVGLCFMFSLASFLFGVLVNELGNDRKGGK